MPDQAILLEHGTDQQAGSTDGEHGDFGKAFVQAVDESLKSFDNHKQDSIENVSENADGDNIEYALSMEWIGVNWWKESLLGIPFGISSPRVHRLPFRSHLMRFLFLFFLILLPGATMANEIPIQMTTLYDVQDAASPDIHEGVSEAPAGAVYFPDQILAAAVDRLEGDAGMQLKNWNQTHRFLIIPFSISIRPNDNNIPEAVDVTLAIDVPEDLARQPTFIDIFPPNGFKKAPFEGSAGLEVGADGKLGSAAKARANIAFNYNFSPAYANVVSGIASTHAFWQYRRTQENYPVGEIPMKLLVVIPRGFGESEIVGNFDVNVDFGGSFFIGKSARARFASVIYLPG